MSISARTVIGPAAIPAFKPFESGREFPSVKAFNLNVISFFDPGFYCGQGMDPTNRRGFLYPFRQNASNVSPDGFITASRHTLANHVKGFFPGYGFPLAVFPGSDSLKRGLSDDLCDMMVWRL